MTNRIFTILSLVFILASCRQNQCDFKNYINNLKVISRPLTFKNVADLNVTVESNIVCDSTYFGKGYQAIGIVSKEDDFYSVLLKSEDKLFLTTIDLNGKLLDKVELEQNNGYINDSLRVWTTYELLNANLFCRMDTIEVEAHGDDGTEYVVSKPQTDTIKYLNGKIIK